MGAHSWANEVKCKTDVRGIDVSAWQNQITQQDWFDLKNKWKCMFAFIKASEGRGYRSPTFGNDFMEAKAAGVLRGAYHFYSQFDDPMAQADLFCDQIGSMQPGDLPPVLDLEAIYPRRLGPADAQRALTILAAIELNLGVRPILYCGAYAFNEMGPAAVNMGFEKYPLWLPMYTMGTPFVPKPWTEMKFWQFTDRGDSTEGPIDWDYFNGTYDELLSMSYGPKPPQIDKGKIDQSLIMSKVDGQGLENAMARTLANIKGWYQY